MLFFVKILQKFVPYGLFSVFLLMRAFIKPSPIKRKRGCFFMFRKRISAILVAMCLLSLCITGANALVGAQPIPEQPQTEQPKSPLIGPGDTVITPFYDYTNTTNTAISIPASGLAVCTGVLMGYQGTTTKVSIYIYLQQYKSSGWTTIQSWSASYNTYKGTLQGTYNVPKGYTYRVMASYYAYNGAAYENIVRYSPEVKH